MTNTVPEGLHGLARQNAARGIGHGARDHDGPAPATVFEKLLKGIDSCLGIQRVEDGFNKEKIDATFEQGLGLLKIAAHERIEGDVAGTGVVDVGRNGSGSWRWTKGTRHKPRPVRR